MRSLVEVLLIGRSRQVERPFTYVCDEEIIIGQRVEVSFGRGKSIAKGLVVGVEQYNDENLIARDIDEKLLKNIISITHREPLFTDKSMSLAKWIAKETLSSEISAMELFFPKGEGISLKRKKFIKLISLDEILRYKDALRKNAKIALTVVETIIEKDSLYLEELINKVGAGARESVKKLENLGIIKVIDEEFIPRVNDNYSLEHKDIFLNDEQEAVKESILLSKKPCLLYGVTGSGKTEVYIKLIRDVLTQGKEAIVLVPEISLTPQTISRFRNVFGDMVGIMHSRLSEREKLGQWQLVKSGKVKVVIGARSALFVPFRNLGIIIVDECHEDSYKSENSPKFDGVDLAVKMGEVYKAIVVLGTATPTINQLYNGKIGKFTLLYLRNRGNKSSKPIVEIINMNKERKLKNSVLSSRLVEEIGRGLLDGNQSIVFLNRRGFANFLRCDECGYVHVCKNCDISLNYHKSTNSFVCHYCGYKEPYEEKCPSCAEGNMVYSGVGTQQVEEALREKFPTARIVRMDRDTTKLKGQHESILRDFKEENIDILLGTQMIGKGLDFPKVTVVGVINGDLGLKFPDYRSREKTFAILNQVVGRAGRGNVEGKALIQTYEPDNPIYRYIADDDFESLYSQEVAMRKQFFYPPFANIIRVLASSINPKSAATTAQRLKDGICHFLDKKNIDQKILGPTPCLINKVEGKYRWQIIIKVINNDEYDIIKEIINYLISIKRNVVISSDAFVSIDINPKNMI
ncbi:MAG: replication restart helicase PriA [Filifactoraceae bacterium]